MDRAGHDAVRERRRIPHARGDGPIRTWGEIEPVEYSPRTWGWTEEGEWSYETPWVFPTHVGMDRATRSGLRTASVFPTHVGMDRHTSTPATRTMSIPHARGDGPPRPAAVQGLFCIPHARGDGPKVLKAQGEYEMYSPRTWGWTVNTLRMLHKWVVFPTHVGMDRRRRRGHPPRARIPHARGDGPPRAALSVPAPMYSPRTWGWTEAGSSGGRPYYVFPTHVGMDRRGH